MRKFKCCLRGAYGPGNFGDDLLLLSSLKILEKIYDKSDICITIHDKEKAEIFLEGYNIIPFSSPVKSNVTFLGGGGQYFSFKSENKKNKKFLEKFKSLKKSGMKISDFIYGYYIRKYFNRRWLSEHDVGFCLGLGPFDDKDSRLYNLAKLELSKFSYLSVRDNASYKQAKDFGAQHLDLFCDPIFDSSLWLNEDIIFDKKTNNAIIIIRGWPFDKEKDDKIKEFIGLATVLRMKGYSPVFVSLYKDYDSEIIEFYESHGENVVCWDPINSNLKDFLKMMQSSSFLITTRAHGAIVPAVLGVSPIIVNIEPKLEKVHGMLAVSSLLVGIDSIADVDYWYQLLDDYLDRKSELNNGLKSDLEKNNQLSKNAIDDVLNFLISIK